MEVPVLTTEDLKRAILSEKLEDSIDYLQKFIPTGTGEFVVATGYDLQELVNLQHENGISMLDLAIARNNNVDLVQSLLDYGAKLETPVEEPQKKLFTPLMSAIHNKNLPMVNLLLQRGADVNEKAKNDETALHLAVASKTNNDIVELLLAYGADSNASTTDGTTVLERAVLHSTVEMVEFLLLNQTYLDATVLHLAYQLKDKGIFRFLVESGADVNAIDENGTTILHYMFHNNHQDIANEIEEMGLPIDFTQLNDFNAYYYALTSEEIDILKLIMSRGANANITFANGLSPLHYLCRMKGTELFTLFLDHGADVNATNCFDLSPLSVAFKFKRSDLIRILLERNVDFESLDFMEELQSDFLFKPGNEDILCKFLELKVDVNKKDVDKQTLLNRAIVLGNVKVVDLLVANGANVNVKGNKDMSELETAVSRGNAEMVRILLARGARIGQIFNKAVELGNRDIVELLIDHRASVDGRIGGEEPMDIAVERGHEKIVELLLMRGARKKASSLSMAIYLGHREVVEILLKQGYELKGTHALHSAVVGEDEKMVRLLLQYGADLKVKNSENRTALSLAIERQQLGIIELLVKNGADVNEKGQEEYPLHMAVETKNRAIVELLMNSRASLDVENERRQTPVTLAAYMGYHDICRLFIVRMTLMRAMGESVKEKNLMVAETCASLTNYEILCREEIERTKEVIRFDDNSENSFTWFDLFSFANKLNLLVLLANNATVIGYLRSDEFVKEFPIYGNLLRRYFEGGAYSKKCLDKALAFFSLLARNGAPQLPYTCVYQIYCYLSAADVVNLTCV